MYAGNLHKEDEVYVVRYGQVGYEYQINTVLDMTWDVERREEFATLRNMQGNCQFVSRRLLSRDKWLVRNNLNQWLELKTCPIKHNESVDPAAARTMINELIGNTCDVNPIVEEMIDDDLKTLMEAGIIGKNLRVKDVEYVLNYIINKEKAGMADILRKKEAAKTAKFAKKQQVPGQEPSGAL